MIRAIRTTSVVMVLVVAGMAAAVQPASAASSSFSGVVVALTGAPSPGSYGGTSITGRVVGSPELFTRISIHTADRAQPRQIVLTAESDRSTVYATGIPVPDRGDPAFVTYAITIYAGTGRYAGATGSGTMEVLQSSLVAVPTLIGYLGPLALGTISLEVTTP